MITEKIGKRGVLCTFEEDESFLGGGTSIYLINTEKSIFLCDTHLGPSSMKIVNNFIKNHLSGEKEIIVFNSHSDWDHIWGNSVFSESYIIAHELCRRRMRERGEYDIERYKGKYHQGDIEIKLPNITFSDRLKFEDDGIEFVYAPGHTVDSAICIDYRDSAIFVGDLVEAPYPYFNHYDLETYVGTLKYLKSIPAKYILSAHSGKVDRELIDKNIKYIKMYQQNNRFNKEEKARYNYNMKNMLLLKYEDKIRKRLGKDFDYKEFKKNLWTMLGVDYSDLVNEHIHLQNVAYNDLEKTLKKF